MGCRILKQFCLAILTADGSSEVFVAVWLRPPVFRDVMHYWVKNNFDSSR